MCVGLHIAALVLHQVEHQELEDGFGVALHCFWMRRYEHQLGVGCGQDY